MFIKKSILAVIALGSLTSAAFAGPGSTGGGDAAEVEFSNIGRAIVSDLMSKNAQVGFDLKALSDLVSQTEVVMVRHTIVLDGQQRDAINLPALKQIQVDRANWISLNGIQKAELVYHEYLGIGAVEHNNYSTSQSVLALLGADELKKIAAAAMPDPLYSCAVHHTNESANIIYENCGQIDFHNVVSGPQITQRCGGIWASIERQPGGLEYLLSNNSSGSASMTFDEYNAPATFELELDVLPRKHGSGSFEKYVMSCSKKPY